MLSGTGFGAFPSRAHAIFGVADVVFDPAAFTQMISDWGVQGVQTALSEQGVFKDVVLDGIARFAIQTALQTMVQSMSNWAASGFDGSPSFETDLKQSMLRIGDTIANDFAYQLRTSAALSSPFSSRVAQATQDNYYRVTGPQAFENRAKYTLAEKCTDHEAFLAGDFSACGVGGWLDIWQNPANNPIGAQLLAEDQLAQSVSGAAGQHVQQLDWGGGFLSWKGDCTAYADATSFGQDASVPLHEEDECLENRIETPGSVVAHSVNKFAVDVGVDFSVNADEINEVIVDFFNQLVTDTLFGDEGGLGSSGRYERPVDQRPTQSMVNTLVSSFSSQKPRLDQYRRDWNAIRTAAISARNELRSCSGVQLSVSLEEVEELIERADAEIERVTLTYAKYAELETRIADSQTGADSFQAIISDYENFRASGIIPDISDFTYATEQANAGATSEGETLAAKMTRYAKSCPSVFERFGGN